MSVIKIVLVTVPENQVEREQPAAKKSRAELEKEVLAEDYLKIDTNITTANLIKKEMQLFEAHPQDDMPPRLLKLKNALLSVVPTSVEPERCFSAAGLFVTKFRTCLKDDILDTMILLRSFLKEEKKRKDDDD